jgi:type IV secretion system protein VirB3
MSNLLKADPLFVGLTRPSMLFGVSYNLAIINAMLSMITYIVTSNFIYFAMMFPLHLVGYYLCSKEPRLIELILNKNQYFPRCWNYTTHKGNSYDPS